MRRAKSDGIDAELLLRTLLAWLRGEPRVYSMVPVPDEADEDARRCARERTELISERVGLTNRIGAVLAKLGVTDYNPLLRVTVLRDTTNSALQMTRCHHARTLHVHALFHMTRGEKRGSVNSLRMMARCN
jgi:transposase